MGRPGGVCALCGGPKRGRSGRRASIAGYCHRCFAPVCMKHKVWDSTAGADLCTRCLRKEG